MMPRLTDVVKNLIIINVIVFFSIHFLLTMYPLKNYFVLYPIQSGLFEPYQIVSSMFNHSDFRHLLFNMLALYFIGPMVEYTLGAKRFLFLYLAAGLLSGVLHLMFSDHPAVGASGAINGVVIAFALMYPNVKMMVFPIPFEIRAIILCGLFIVYDLLGGIGVFQDNIAHWAHLGGAAMGAFLTWRWGLIGLQK